MTAAEHFSQFAEPRVDYLKAAIESGRGVPNQVEIAELFLGTNVDLVRVMRRLDGLAKP